MKVILADTFYWIAILNPRDQWYQIALNYGRKQPNIRLVLTDGIIDEVLNYFAEEGIFLRNNALKFMYKYEMRSQYRYCCLYTPITKSRI